jgi:hypothetical protein
VRGGKCVAESDYLEGYDVKNMKWIGSTYLVEEIKTADI